MNTSSLAKSCQRARPLILLACLFTLFSACRGESDAPARETLEREDGSSYTSINASDKDAWVYFDLDAPDAADPGEGDGWDLSFRRQKIRIHDEAGVVIALVDKKDLDEGGQTWRWVCGLVAHGHLSERSIIRSGGGRLGVGCSVLAESYERAPFSAYGLGRGPGSLVSRAIHPAGRAHDLRPPNLGLLYRARSATRRSHT